MPAHDNNLIWQAYFCTFLVLGSFFVLNLFDGIVIQSYGVERDRVKIGIPNITAG